MSRWEGLYAPPLVVPGVVCVTLAVAFAVNVFLAVDPRSHSVSDTLYGVSPFWLPAFLLLLGDKSAPAARTPVPFTRHSR